MVDNTSSSHEGGTSPVDEMGKEETQVWGLMDYLARRGMVQPTIGADTDGTRLITYHLTDSGFQVVERILEVLVFLGGEDPSDPSTEAKEE